MLNGQNPEAEPLDSAERLIGRGLKLNHLRLVAALAETGQLTSAGRALRLAQPAASRLLAEAESIAGHRLCERLPKGVTMTAAGDALARRARSALAEIAEAGREIGDVAEGRLGSVRHGVGDRAGGRSGGAGAAEAPAPASGSAGAGRRHHQRRAAGRSRARPARLHHRPGAGRRGRAAVRCPERRGREAGAAGAGEPSAGAVAGGLGRRPGTLRLGDAAARARCCAPRSRKR